jgi:hypothetical protein
MSRKDSLIYGIGIVVMLACLSIFLAACNLPSFGRQSSAKKPTPTSTTGGISIIGHGFTPTSTIGHNFTPTSTIGHDFTPTSTIGHDFTPTSTTGSDSTSISPDSTSTSATVSSSAKSCGTLRYQQASNTMGLVLAESNNDAQKIANCILQAFKQCASASIEMNISIGAARINPSSVNNVRMFSTKLPADGGAANLYQFTINSQAGSCVVSEVEQAYSVVAPTPSTPQTCGQVEQTGTDLRFVNCGNAGTITFPLA